MLTKEEIPNLENHITGLFQTIIVPEINPKGYILTVDSDGQPYPDAVTTHHLVELCLEISPILTSNVINNACHWFFDSVKNLQNPFFVTTLAETNSFSKEDKEKILTELIGKNQKPSGFIDLYAGFLDGGSAFSTLWAIRITSLLSEGSSEYIEKAFSAIESHWEDLHRASFKGFYYEISLRLGRENEHTATALREILEAQDSHGKWDESDFYTAYIIGNLVSSKDKTSKSNIDAAALSLRKLFELGEEAKGIPNTFSRARSSFVDSAFLQFCMRSLISAIRYLKVVHGIDMQEKLTASLFGLLPHVYHSAKLLNAELKLMNNQYGNIKLNFDHLEKKVAETILSESPYDKNVFIMMPFRHEDDERYERIVKSIKTTLEKYGFKGWMASDKTVTGQLWDNVACFMLACKYGISIFTRVEKESEIRVKEFNPNVSLELGFFLSRGKKVLILKDKILPSLQTDLVGHLYEPFDLNKSGAQIPGIIEKWVKELIAEEKKESQQGSAENT